MDNVIEEIVNKLNLDAVYNNQFSRKLSENDNVVRAFLRVNSSFEIEEKTQYYPNIHGTDGFFICKMKKSSKLVER